MRVLVQRCLKSSVVINRRLVNEIDHGMVVLVGFSKTDDLDNVKKMIKKIVNLRIFDDEKNMMNKSIKEVHGSILSISQFTLYADTSKGCRPSYFEALNYSDAEKLYDKFNELLSKEVPVKTGVFGSDMQIKLINDGPITVMLEN